MNSLIAPLSEIDNTLSMGISRLAVPDFGSLLGDITGGVAIGKKPSAANLIGDLLNAAARLLENLLTRGPIGELLNGLLGGILGGVGGTVSGVLGGGSTTGQVGDLVDGISGNVGQLLPGAGAVVGGVVPKSP